MFLSRVGIILIFICGFLFNAEAQDRIHYKSGNMLEVKMLEVSSTEVVYKKANNIDGPTYHELKSLISKVEYANGTTDIFAVQPAKANEVVPKTAVAPAVEPSKAAPFEYKKNALTYTVSDALFRRITIAYERIFANGHLSVKVPVSFGLASNKLFDVDYLNSYSTNDNNNNYYYYNSPPSNELNYTSIIRKQTFGLELFAYPFGQHPVSFYVGPAFYYGLVDYKIEETIYYSISPSPYSSYGSYTQESSGSCVSYSGMINTGLSFAGNSNFAVLMQIGLGFRQNRTDFDDYAATIFNPSFHIGYKF